MLVVCEEEAIGGGGRWACQTSTAATDAAGVDDMLVLEKEAISGKNHNM